MVHNIGAMACTYSSGRIMNGNWLELNGNGTNSVYFQSVCIRSHGTGTVTMIIIMTILKLQLKTTFTWAFSLFFLVFTFQMTSFHEIISKPNKTLWPNLSSLPQSVPLQYLFTLIQRGINSSPHPPGILHRKGHLDPPYPRKAQKKGA